MKKLLGEKIKKARMIRGLSQKEFGELLGVSNSVVSNWERGKNNPSTPTLKMISNVLNTTFEDLVGETFEDVVATSNEELGIIDHDGILRKYSQLDETGKEIIQYMVDKELERSLDKQKAFIYPMFETNEKNKEYVELDYYPQAAGMGRGQDVIPSAPEKLEVQIDQIPRYTDYIIRVTGDSMEPTYMTGDLLFIQKTDVLNKGDIGVFVIEGETMVKEMGENELISHNSKYEPIKSGDGCFIQGRVVGKYERS